MPNDASIVIRLTKKEKAVLQKLALIEGKNMTDFIKSKVFDLNPIIDKKVQPQNKVEQYLDLISKVTLANNIILSKTLAKDFTQEEKEQIRSEINEKLEISLNSK